MIQVLRGDWLGRVRLLRTVLGWAGWIEGGIGIASYVAYASNVLQMNIPEAPSQRPQMIISLLSGAYGLFAWVIPFAAWAILTLLIEIYELLDEDDEEEIIMGSSPLGEDEPDHQI